MNWYAGVAEWQTHRTQNATGNRAGSSPATGTSFRTLLSAKAVSFFMPDSQYPLTANVADVTFALMHDFFYDIMRKMDKGSIAPEMAFQKKIKEEAVAVVVIS